MKEAEDLRRSMKRGFNTYFNNSVLTHVMMPEGIAIGLSLKFYDTAKVVREALIGRQGEGDETVRPGPRSYDGSYTELTLSCGGQDILIQSRSSGEDQHILVTPLKVPRCPPTLIVSLSILWNGEGYAWRDGERLAAKTSGRGLELFTDGTPVRQLNAGMTNPYLSVELARPVAISTSRGVAAAELAEVMGRAKRLVIEETHKYGELAECYNAMRTCLAWDSIYEPETDRVCSPVSRIWSVNWGGYVLFDWDTYFASMMAMVENKELAYSNAIAITRQKTEAGFIPNFGGADGFKSRDRSQPPVGAFALREIYRAYREEWIVEFLFDDLLEWNRWFSRHRMLPNGQLCLGSDPYDDPMGRRWGSLGVNEALGAVLESGQDNSPLYDDVPFDAETHLLSLADVGFTGLYVLDCECLAELAEVTGRSESRELRERAELCKEGLEGLWNEEIGMYCNRRTDTGEFSTRLGPTNFYALFSDGVPREREGRMMREHFFNEEEFFGRYMIPSIARNDPAYRDQEYWRGRIWAPLNFLVYVALRKRGLVDAYRVLADKGRDLLMNEWASRGHVHENYNADSGEGCDVASSDRFYHWGGLLSLVSLIDAGFVPGPELPL